MLVTLLGIIDILGGLAIFLIQQNILFLAIPMAVLLIMKSVLSGILSLKSFLFFALSCIDFAAGIVIILLLNKFSGDIFLTFANALAIVMIIKGFVSAISLK